MMASRWFPMAECALTGGQIGRKRIVLESCWWCWWLSLLSLRVYTYRALAGPELLHCLRPLVGDISSAPLKRPESCNALAWQASSQPGGGLEAMQTGRWLRVRAIASGSHTQIGGFVSCLRGLVMLDGAQSARQAGLEVPASNECYQPGGSRLAGGEKGLDGW